MISMSIDASTSQSAVAVLNVPTFITSNPPSASTDGVQSRSSIDAAFNSLSVEPDSPTDASDNPDVDPQILEALRSKDRLFVLKLGELMEGLINERRTRLDLTPATSYQRLLVRRCSAYYKLSPEGDTKGIAVLLTQESRIPPRRLCELVPAETASQPAFKIMRRSAQDRVRTKPHSQAGSVAGEDADFSDVEPSESGSLGGRSNATGGSSSKKRMTIEEREAAYNEARSRIFMDFEEKEKEKDMSASSSTLSLVSGSASTSGGGTGGSSVDDLDDSVSSPATESEWSGPNPRDKRDGRRVGSGSTSAASSSRSLRSAAQPFATNGASSSRGSRAPSPAFTFATLYEPPPSSSGYDPSHFSSQVPVPGYGGPYMYPYSQPTQPPLNQLHIAPYQFFPPYPYPPPTSPSSDPSTPASAEMYSPQHPGYMNPYGWPSPPLPPSQPMHAHTTPQSHMTMNHQNTSPNQNVAQYPTAYINSPFPFPMSTYYPPHPGQQGQPLPHMMGQPPFSGEGSRPMNGSGFGNGNRAGYTNGTFGLGSHTRTPSRNSTGQNISNGGAKRNGPPPRSAWSYGPGIGISGFGSTIGLNGSSVDGGEIVGPRLSSSMRRGSGSGTSVGSTGNRTSTGDEASSTASSSTTSSSSRRTYTSTTSSQHPLPPRPDWAVGLKPQPTLHSSHNRHHENSFNSRNNISPGRNGNTNLPPHQSQAQQMAPVLLQSTDFPPLTSLASTPEKRTPLVAGAWTNTSPTRSILMPSPGHSNSIGNALVHPGNLNITNTRPEELDRGFERPAPKSNSELFNPKVTRRPSSKNQQPQDKTERDKDKPRGDVAVNAVLIGELATMSLEDKGGDGIPAMDQDSFVLGVRP